MQTGYSNLGTSTLFGQSVTVRVSPFVDIQKLADVNMPPPKVIAGYLYNHFELINQNQKGVSLDNSLSHLWLCDFEQSEVGAALVFSEGEFYWFFLTSNETDRLRTYINIVSKLEQGKRNNYTVDLDWVTFRFYSESLIKLDLFDG